MRLIELLARTGVRRLEVDQLRPRRRDPAAGRRPRGAANGRISRTEVAVSVLVPNERGLEAALELRERIDEVNVFLSASETHNQRNVEPVRRGVAGRAGAGDRAGARGRASRVEGVIATSFGCPYEGEVPVERVLEIAAQLVAAGAEEVGFGDTTGMANPLQVARLLRRAPPRRSPTEVELTAHFHNTRGQGLANVLAALEAGCSSFESSFGELGGCPVPAGATGNIATEDLVSMLEEMGIETGVDLGCPARRPRARPSASSAARSARTRWSPAPVDWHAGSE